MYTESWIQQEAHHRQKEMLDWAAQRRLLEEAWAYEKAQQPKRPGTLAKLLVHLGRVIEAKGRYLQERFGSDAMKPRCGAY